jgi:hypothetical protein
VTDEQRQSLMLPFRSRTGNLPAVVAESGFHVPGALDAIWRSRIIRGIEESRPTASSGRSLTTGLMSGLPPPTAINENFNKRLIPFVCRFEQSEPGLVAGYSQKFETESEMKRASCYESSIGNRKLTLKPMRRQKWHERRSPASITLSNSAPQKRLEVRTDTHVD